MSSSAPREPVESLESLRARVGALRAQVAILKAHHGRTTTREQQPAGRPARFASLGAALLPQSSSSDVRQAFQEPLELEVARARERARAFRITGRSAFEVELEVGKRARREMEHRLEQGKGKGKGREDPASEPKWVRKGVCVRLETFFEGKFYEPHYVVFGRAKAPAEADVADRRDSTPAPLEIVHHTLPGWIPLRQLSNQYLGVRIRGDERLGEDGDGAPSESPADLAPDLDLFLSRLSQYLNASVARRQQLVELRTAFAAPEHAALDFRVFNNASSDRVIVEWDLSPRGAGDDNNDADAQNDDDGDAVGPEQRLVAVHAAFCDLRHVDLAADDLLVRYVERRAGAEQAPSSTTIDVHFVAAGARDVRRRQVGEVVTTLVALSAGELGEVAGWRAGRAVVTM